MTTQEIDNQYASIMAALDGKALKAAFDHLQGLIAGTRAYAFQDRLDELQDMYRQMLRYCVEGVDDPMRERIYMKVIASAYDLADQVKHNALATLSDNAFYSHRRMARRLAGMSYEGILTQLMEAVSARKEAFTPEITSEKQRQIEYHLDALFEKVWTSEPLRVDEVEQLKALFREDRLPAYVGCQVVSALTLGLEMSFDIEKLSLLFFAACLRDERIRCRALIGILLTLYLHRHRVEQYPRVRDWLASLSETFPAFGKSLRTVSIRFILARETEKVTRKLQEEILPRMAKISQKLHLEDIGSEIIDEGMNPEWEKTISESELEKNIMDLNEMQAEGVDIMHSSFIHLKGFPFFRELSHWFLPFMREHSSLTGHAADSRKGWNALSDLSDASTLCDSDKYSIYFSFLQMPDEARRMILEQISGQPSDFAQAAKKNQLDKWGSFEILVMQYVQDLYRFHKLYPRHQDFEDIFASPMDLQELPFLRPYYDNADTLRALGECYLRKNHFLSAQRLYVQLAQHESSNEVIYQKIGYCKQMEGDFMGAVEAYQHADLLRSDNPWVLRRLASCYRSLKRPDKALAYFRRCEVLRPDDLSVQIGIGHCHLEQGAYDEALQCFFKVDYLDPKKGAKAWRPIAWCSFLTGKYEQARRYYEKILRNHPNMADCLNAGHTEWALRNLKGAVTLYKQAINLDAEEGIATFEKLFKADIPDLLAAGIDGKLIPLVMDEVKYQL